MEKKMTEKLINLIIYGEYQLYPELHLLCLFVQASSMKYISCKSWNNNTTIRNIGPFLPTQTEMWNSKR
jgi:hypothetical protein